MTGVLYPTFCGVVGGVLPAPTTYLPETVVPPNGWASAASAFVFGNRFTVGSPFTMTAASYYYSTATAGLPTSLRLWNSGSNTLLATVATPNPGSAGWHRVVFGTPIALTTGVIYVLGLTAPSDTTFTGWFANPPAVNSPFTHLDIRRSTDVSGNCPTEAADPALFPFVMMALSLDDA